MPVRTKLFITIGIIALTGVIYGYQEYTRKNKDYLYADADFTISAKDFIREFEENENAANEKFLDKIIAVNDTIKDIIKDDEGFYTLMIGEKNKTSSVRCSMDPNHQTEVELLRMGNIITIKGACTGYNQDELLGSDVILNHCVIEKGG